MSAAWFNNISFDCLQCTWLSRYAAANYFALISIAANNFQCSLAMNTNFVLEISLWRNIEATERIMATQYQCICCSIYFTDGWKLQRHNQSQKHKYMAECLATAAEQFSSSANPAQSANMECASTSFSDDYNIQYPHDVNSSCPDWMACQPL